MDTQVRIFLIPKPTTIHVQDKSHTLTASCIVYDLYVMIDISYSDIIMILICFF